MSKISGKETQQEIIVRKFLFSKGLRFRKNAKELPGKPDILLPKFKSVIFVHGCFWHGHNCLAGKLPKTRKEFWAKKINATKNRDKKNIRDLENLNWHMIIIWQCNLGNKVLQKKTLDNLLVQLQNCNMEIIQK
jgi:DNA mismatch endonuclease (patch repair protein)